MNMETHTNNNAYTKRISDCHHPPGDGLHFGFVVGNDCFAARNHYITVCNHYFAP